MTRVKICGIRRTEDAELALQLGAWALGFIFHRPSPRFIEPVEVRRILQELPRETLAVGVFVDWPLEALNEVVSEIGLSAVQLHGGESPTYAAAVQAREVWKAFRVGAEFEPDRVEEYDCVDRVLLDTFSQSASGGTGETFDWSVAKAVSRRRPIVLAGGLNATNVERAVREIKPFGVDVSSGVEESPGVKSRDALQRFFTAVRSVEN